MVRLISYIRSEVTMKTWHLMYLLVWLSLVQIVIILFPVIGTTPSYDLHLIVGIGVISLSIYVFTMVRKTGCPDRIKRITRATAILGIFQGLLGIPLYLSLRFTISLPLQNIILFAHLITGIAIISQSSSSATAFDMWEQKEFAVRVEQP